MGKQRQTAVVVVDRHHSGREPNGKTHPVYVLDKAVATKEGAHSAVKCWGLFGAGGGKDHICAHIVRKDDKTVTGISGRAKRRSKTVTG